jgi:midasin
MNPGSDFGKKELPVNVKRKFTSIYLEEMTDLGDLNVFVKGILGELAQKA